MSSVATVIRIEGMTCETIGCYARAAHFLRGRKVCKHCYDELTGERVNVAQELRAWAKRLTKRLRRQSW